MSEIDDPRAGPAGMENEPWCDEGTDDGEYGLMSPLLPGWFSERMTTDVWSFGLLTATGIILAVERIDRFYQAADGSVWFDAVLIEDSHLNFHRPTLAMGRHVHGAPTSRTGVSVNAAQIIAAFELADT